MVRTLIGLNMWGGGGVVQTSQGRVVPKSINVSSKHGIRGRSKTPRENSNTSLHDRILYGLLSVIEGN